jgi:hypothetical protein
MVSLPDGTIMILNGAHHGAAGFGLASDPNLNALLYDPTQPIGSRFAILGNTIVARLYHSEATLLPDGRVLVSGSDPQTPGFPEEYRIEVRHYSLTICKASQDCLVGLHSTLPQSRLQTADFQHLHY